MAVASFQQPAGVVVGTRQFAPPKRASLSAWYRAAIKQIPEAPRVLVLDDVQITVNEHAITIDHGDWVLFIARKRDLR